MDDTHPTVSQALDDLKAALAELSDDTLRGAGVWPEDQLKTPVKNFLDGVSSAFGKHVRVRTEDAQPQMDQGVAERRVRLDIAVIDTKTQGRVGHIELKAPGKGADPTTPAGRQGWTKHDTNQWKRLDGHPNLIYCNGSEWTLLRSGVKVRHLRLDAEGETAVGALLADFFDWTPEPPRTARALAERLAPLARLLRDAVTSELAADTAKTGRLHSMLDAWRATLMPDATEPDFADSVAQTFTYALLLARLNERIVLPLDSEQVGKALRAHGHGLLGSVLALLASEDVRATLDEPVGLIESTIAAVDPDRIRGGDATWLYFYEDFLAEYDPKRRKDSGVYYTPVEVVQAQVRLVNHVLQSRFGLSDGLGNPSVRVLDPATGTGTYLLAAAKHVLDAAEEGGLPLADTAKGLRGRLYGFELLIGAYSVAHLSLEAPIGSGVTSGREV
jgi:hypothetical protein